MRGYHQLLFFIVLCQIGYCQFVDYRPVNYEFKIGNFYHMFGDRVKLRTKPNTTARVLAHLKIGDRIKIIEKMEAQMPIDGTPSNWYKVAASGKVGFVLGSFIAVDKTSHGNTTLLIRFKRVNKAILLKTRVYKKGSIYSESEFNLLNQTFVIRNMDNRGIDGIKSIFEIDYVAYGEAINDGGMYLLCDGEKLISAIEYNQVYFEDEYSIVEKYIFPDDKGGIPKKIIYNKETFHKKDYETDWTERVETRRVLHWNGKAIVPKIKLEKDKDGYPIYY